MDPDDAIVTVPEVVAHLRAQKVLTGAADQDQLLWLAIVATDAVERDLGRHFVQRTITETYSGGRGAFILRSGPVISITSVSEAGVPLTIGTDYQLSSDAPILYRGSTSSRACWAAGMGNVSVTYVVGYASPPPVVRKVVLNAVQGMWQASQQAAHAAMDEFGADNVGTAAAALTDIERAGYESLRVIGFA